MSALREIIANFGVSFDTGALDAGKSKIEGAIDSLMGMAKVAAGAFAVKEVYEYITGLTENAAALERQAEALGLSIGELQQWNYAAEMSGVSAATLSGTLGKIGSGKFDKGLATLGIATKDANGELRGSTDILGDVADALASIENPAERNRKAVKVLGKPYKELLPLLEGGSEGIKKFRDEFEEMGGGFGEDFAKKSHAFDQNIVRLKTRFHQIGISIVGEVLPYILQFSNFVVDAAKAIAPFITNSRLLEVGLGALAVAGILKLSSTLGPLGKLISSINFKMLGWAIVIGLIVLALDDLTVFMEGGDSILGRLLGPAMSEKVRAGIADVGKELKGFFNDLTNNPTKILDDWNVFTTQLDKDVRSVFGDTFGEMISIAGGMFNTFIDLLTGGWDNFANKTDAIWQYVKLIFQIAWVELEGGFVHLAAMIGDSFISMWNSVMEGAGKVQKAINDAALALHLISKETHDKGNAAVDADNAALPKADMADTVSQARDANRAELTAKYDAIQAQLNAPANAPQLTTTVNVTVPPGTPEQLANNVGAAAAKGATNANATNLRAAKAATKPGG